MRPFGWIKDKIKGVTEDVLLVEPTVDVVNDVTDPVTEFIDDGVESVLDLFRWGD